jgi:uncharacterized protein (DUF2236 family)
MTRPCNFTISIVLSFVTSVLDLTLSGKQQVNPVTRILDAMSRSSWLVEAARPAQDRLRRSVAVALRDRVAGRDNAAKAALIWDKPGERWFTQSDPIWRVHADASMFLAGIRALLLQSLHPLAMAGVAGHSGYKGDPWGRLQRTSTFLATTTFGTIEDAEAIIERVRGIHEHVRGKAPDGRPYAATDPHLLRWVHVAEADSFLRAHQRYGITALTSVEADRYVAQSGVVAARMGVIDPPATVAGLADALDSYRDELQGTPAAQEAARFLLLHPPLPLGARPGYSALAGAAVALLPLWARRPLSLPYFPLTERAVAIPVGGAATNVIRWALAHPREPLEPG